jgi:hypothetical protein
MKKILRLRTKNEGTVHTPIFVKRFTEYKTRHNRTGSDKAREDKTKD